MKRFWKAAEAVAAADGWAVELDGKPIRTPARALLVLPTDDLARAIVAEWEQVGEAVDPRAMPMTGLANAAIDRVAPQKAEFAARLAKYAEADLACYRADFPRELAGRQTERWDSLLAWARRRYDVDFCTTTGVIHVAQPEATVQGLKHAVAALDPFRLAAMSPLVTSGGSLLAALAVLEQAIGPQEAWRTVTIDEEWQREQWGADEEAEAALEARRRDFLAAARFLELLDS